MKQHLTTISAVFFTAFTAFAAVPCEWIATPRTPSPAAFDRFHGETIDFRCTFTGFGALPFAEGADVRLWYQTNGMGAAWWSIPATVSNNVLAATFTPSADPGAERLTIFFGAPSNAYAAAQVRFRNSPGATPNHLDPPSVLDWRAELAAAMNAVYTKAEADARIAELAPRTSLEPATNYTDALEAKITSGAIRADEVNWAAWANNAGNADTAGSADTASALNGDGAQSRSADQIFAQLDAASHITTNDVCAIVTNEVSEYTTNDTWICNNPTGESWAPEWNGTGWRMPVVEILLPEDATSYTLKDEQSPEPGQGDYIFTRIASSKRNAIGLAKRSDITNIVDKAYVESLGIESGVSEATVTNVVRSVAYAVNDYMWDGDVCWRRQMLKGGYLEYVAVTNIDVTLPENYKALEALEKARRNQE